MYHVIVCGFFFAFDTRKVRFNGVWPGGINLHIRLKFQYSSDLWIC